MLKPGHSIVVANETDEIFPETLDYVSDCCQADLSCMPSGNPAHTSVRSDCCLVDQGLQSVVSNTRPWIYPLVLQYQESNL